MKTKLNLLFILLGLLLGIAGCTDLPTNGVVPIYRGMTVSSQLTQLTSYGILDEENPGIIDPFFEEDIQNAFGNLTQIEVDYFAPPQSTLYITINVYNPDQYEILSFTLNGKKYQSYEFEDGSNSENLILSVQTGEISGVIEYTIDAIKYIDGTAINDVRMEGDQTVSVGVEQTNLPFSTISNVVLGSSSITFDVKVTDYAELIIASEKPAKVFLFDGLSIISEQDLPDEVNSIVFDQLEPGTNYQYAVAAAYDKTDTFGMQVVILSYQEFSTYEMINIADVQPTQDSINFSLDIIDENAVGTIQSIDLYLNDELIESKVATDTYTFSNLLSNNAYQLKLTYTYDLNDGNGEQVKYQIEDIQTLSKQLPTIEYANLNISQEGVLFDLTYSDIDQVGAVSSIELYKDDLLVKSIEDLTNLIGLSFDELLSNNSYQIKTTVTYDLNDGNGSQSLILTYDVVTVGKQVPTIEYANLNIFQEGVIFDLTYSDIDQVGAVSSIELYKDDLLVISIEDLTNLIGLSFDELLSNNSYQIKTTVTYDLNDGNGSQLLILTYDVVTVAKQVPTIEYANLDVSQEGVLFDLTYSDIDQVGAVSSIELYQDDLLVKSIEDLTNLIGLSFDELLSNNSYQIKTTMTYDLNDGNGPQSMVFNQDILTASKTTPILSFDEIDATIDQVNFNYSIDDIDQTGSILDISLYNDSVKEQTLTDLEDLFFLNLIADTEYQVKIQYQYDLNDGSGSQILEVSRLIYTAPYLGIISTEVINTERLTEGDTVYLEIQIDNPSHVTFTYIIINGNTYPVSEVTTQSFIRVEFLIDDSYTGGVTSFVIEKIQGFNHNEERAFDISDNNIGYAFVNGDISVLGVNILDEDGNPLDQAMPGDVFYISIDFDNPTGYMLDQIDLTYLGVIGSSQFTQDESHSNVTIKQTSYYRNTIVEYNINSFTYSDENIGSKTKNVDGFGDFIVCVTNSSFEYIYNATDLKNMRDGYAYKLANDIDLDGIEWTPRDINFVVLDGNGYSISNLRIIKTYLDTHVHIGLFKSINYSSIKNLTIDNVLIMIDLQRESTSTDYQSYGGLIAGSSYMTNFTNVNAYGEMSINNQVGNYNSLGGLVGDAYRSNFDRVYTNVILSGDTTIGGLVGRANEVQVIKSHSSGTLYGDRELGGLFGNAYNTKITNSYSTMDLNVVESVAGGLVGYGSSIYIKDSYYEGTIYQDQTWVEIGGLLTYADNSTIINSFSIAYDKDGNPLNSIYAYWNNITIENSYALAGDESFQTKTAEEMIAIMSDVWDLTIWGFNGGSPVLKWTPSVRIINVLQGETILTFDIATTDFDEVGVIDKIELYKGTELIDSLSDVSLRRFEGLRYNTSYTIKVTYKYSYGDEIGDQFIVVSQNVKTLPVSGTPEIDFYEVGHSFDSLSFGYTLTDDQNVGTFVSIEIYDDANQLITTLLETDDFTFSGLESNQLYKIIITYSYDLDDGYGLQYVTSANYMRTNPYVEVTGIQVLNTDALFIGDILVIQIDIDNPDNVLFTEAVINGTTYRVATSSLTRVRVDLDVDDQFIYGDVELVINSLKGTFMGETYVYDLTQKNTDHVFINGEIYVTSIDTYDMDGEEIDYLENGESFYVDITFYNPTAYDITSIDLNMSQYEWDTYNIQTITTFDLNEMHTVARIQMAVNQPMYQNVNISGFQYSSENLDAQDKAVSGMKTGFVIVNDDTVIEIWTATDLQNIESGYAYKLMADIDLAGISWTPIESFNGVFDGNGKVISNLSIVRSFTDESAYVGLFETIQFGVIKNLNLANISMVITTKSSSTNSFYPYVGALAGQISDMTQISNVAISGDIDTINLTNGQSYTGLLAGYIGQSSLNKIYVSGTINADYYAGGIAGFLSNSSISNAYANLTLTTESSQNGIFAGYGEQLWIKDSYSRGTLINLNNSWGNGGFIGSVYNSIIENVVSFTMDQNQNYIDPIQSAWSNIIENSYGLGYSSYFTQTNFENAIDQIKLVWDLTIWGFSQQYPTLKRIPNVIITNIEPTIDGVSFEITTSDYDKVGEVSSIELYQNGILIESLTDLSLRSFEGLRYSSNYTIKVVYTYDYGDGSGAIMTESQEKFKTLDRENVPFIEFSDVVETYDSVTFNYTITDTLGIGELQSVELYDANDNLIDTLEGTTLLFEELYTDSTYYIRVNYVYDFDDGWGPNILETDYEFHTLVLATPQVEVADITSTINSIGFSIDVEDELLLGVITKVELFSDNVFVKGLSTFDNLVFSNLLSNHYYMVRVTYAYDLNDQNGVQNIIAYSYIWTQYLNSPYYYPYGETSTTDSISIAIYTDDPHEIGEITKISLYDGINKVATLTDLSHLEFTGLYSNHQYLVKITYTYDLNDGYGVRESISQNYVQTNEQVNPDVDFTGLEITQNSIYYEGKLYDSQNLGEITNIALYQGETLIAEAIDGILDVSTLEPDVSYELIVDYQYNLNDTQGVQTEQAVTDFQTAPYANATQTDILNTGTVTIGDTLSLSIFLDNPSEVTFTYVQINGEIYAVASYTVGKIRVDIDVTEDVGSGDTELVVSQLIGVYNNQTYTYDLTDNNVVEVFINGDIYVESLSILNISGDDIETALKNESVRVEIEFYNPTQYDILSIQLNRSDDTVTYTSDQFTIDSTRSLITLEITTATNSSFTVSITNYAFDNDNIEPKTKQVSGITDHIVLLTSQEAISITTIQELQNIQSGYSYRLDSDLDMTNVAWIPIENFSGELDGNGHTISNLTMIGTYTDQSIYAGLFRTINEAVIRDLNLVQISYIITIKTDTNNGYAGSVGGLAGNIENSRIINVMVSGDISLDNRSNGEAYVGLVTGYMSNSYIERVYTNGNLSSSQYVGGLVGVMLNSTIMDSYASTSFISTNEGYAGGLVGHGYDDDIQNSYATGRNYQEWNYGGVSGYIYHSSLTNVFSNVKNKDNQYMALYNGWEMTCENVYSLVYDGYSQVKSLPEILVIMNQKWDLDIWSFNSELPALKRIPSIAVTNIEPAIDGLSFEITTSDFDQVGEVSSIELYQNGILIESLTDLSLRSFEGLRYSSNYTIKVVYTYDYGDGSGAIMTESQEKFKTLDRENVPFIEFSDVVETYDSVTFNYTITDTLGIGELQSVELYDANDNLIQTLDSETLLFEGLYTNSTYYIRVNYVYDFDDGWGANVLEADYELHTLVLATPQVEVADIASTIDSIGFSIDVEDELLLGAITKVELFSDNVFVKGLSTFDNLAFSNLLTNHYYMVRVTYAYDLNDQNGVQNIIAYSYIWTQYLNQPYYGLSSIDSTTSSIGFTIYSDDPHEIGEITKISLYDGINKIATLTDLSQLEFMGLYSNHQYVIKITYTYDTKDGYGVRESVSQHYVQTNEQVNPNVNFTGLEITQNSIYYEGKLYDSQNLGEITNITLYQGDTLIAEAVDGILDVNTLEPDVSYELIVDYQYNLNDTQGLQIEQTITSFQTAPYANATQTDILNTGSVTIGDTLSLSIFLDNPSEVVFTKVVINGETYLVSSYTTSKIRVDIDVTEDVGSGDTELVVSQLMGVYNNQTYTYDLTDNNAVEIFINGDIYVESVSILNSNSDIIETALKSETVRVGIEFYNPTQYDISSVTLYVQGYGEIIYLDNEFSINLNHTYITMEVTTGTDARFAVSIVNYTFDNENIEPKTKQSSLEGSVILLNSAEIISITTAQQLQNMQSGYSYRLDSDLDMSSVIWSPIDTFSGEFDGNGHTISNLTIIGTYTDASIYVGLFGTIRYAVIKDLNLVQISYVITIKTDTSNGYYGRVGGLAGYIENSKITNVMVSGDISLDNRSNGEAFVGLITGYLNMSSLERVYTNGNLNSSQYVGGIVGYSDQSKISDSYASTSFTSTKNSYAGGLLGYGYNTEIQNSYATGRNYQEWSYGGIAGQLGHSLLTNVFSYVKNINNENIRSLYSVWELICNDAYSPVYDGYTQVKTLPEMLAIMNQKWDLDIWSFNGDLPALKRVPTISIVDVVPSEYGFEFGVETTDYDHVGEIIAIELYQDDVLLQSLDDLSIRSFDGLRYGSTYTLMVTYQYSYGDEAGDTSIEITKRIKTLDKENVPIVEVTDVVETKDSVTFDYNITDTLGIGSDIVIKLYDAQYNLIETLEGSTLIFENLLSNYNYVIQVNYTYDFDDGFGTNTAEGIYAFKTLSKVTPTLEFGNVSSTDQNIQFGFIETDPDGVGAITSISLYQDDVLIESLSDLSLRNFEGLDSYTSYRIVVTYDYDLNDTVGTHQITKTYSIKTSPIINATSTELINTEAIIVGDTVVLRISLNNPSEIIFTDVMVNGKVYGVNQIDFNTLIVEILTDGEFTGGLTLLEVTNLYGYLDSDQFNINITENNSTEAFINGDIYVTDVNAEVDGQPIDYLTYYGDFQLVVDFFNPTAYDIEAITIYTENYGEQTFSGAQLISSGDNTSISIDLSADSTNYYYSIQVNKFTYSNETMSSRDRAASNKYTSFVLISDAAVISITTAEELQNMTNGQSYQLMNDIDLAEFSWIPIENFRGYFDGNGYTIHNLNITKTFEDQTPYVGLFARASGAVIKNLNMDNVNLIISIRTYTNTGYDMFVGGLIGYVDSYTRIINVNVQGNLSANNPTNASIYMGGIAGHIGSTTKLQDITTNVTITATGSDNTYMGGVVGYLGNKSEIYNAHSESTLAGGYYIGGVVGFMSSSNVTKVSANTNIQGRNQLGGIVGYLQSSSVNDAWATGVIDSTDERNDGGIAGAMYNSTIENSYSNVFFDVYSSWATGGIVGYMNNTNNVIHSYSISQNNQDQYIVSIGYVESQVQFNSYSLVDDGYSIVLTLEEIQDLIQTQWDSDIWDFSNTDAFGNPLFQ